MPRPKLSPIYEQFIVNYSLTDISNYSIVRLMDALFDEKERQAIGQPVPTESTVRRYRTNERNRIIKENEKNLPHNPLDDEWVIQRKDPDGVSKETKEWVINNILKNRIIRAIVSWSKSLTGETFLTRRNVMWVHVLRDVISDETPVSIWSLAVMYSEYERHNELYGSKYKQRYLDDYISYRPWAEKSNESEYEDAVRQGLTVSLNTSREVNGHRIRLLYGEMHDLQRKETEGTEDE